MGTKERGDEMYVKKDEGRREEKERKDDYEGEYEERGERGGVRKGKGRRLQGRGR